MSEQLTLKIEKVVAGGQGMARHEGRVVFVSGVLPGEEVRVEVVEAKKDFAKAELREVIVPSPDRVAPPCSLAGTCGGCDWLHIDPVAQAKLKIEIVRDALRRVGGLEWPDLRIETGSSLGYRNRLQLHTGKGSVGFLERRGHGFVPVKHCPVAHPAFAPLFEKGSNPGSPERFHAFATNDAQGNSQLWREDETTPLSPPIPPLGARGGEGLGVRVPEVEITILGKKLVFPVNGFFQSNLEMLERLIPFALEGLSGKTVFDLYSGVGLFGTFLRSQFSRVVCVESNRSALEFAKRNMGSKGAAFIAGQLEVLVSRSDNPLKKEQPDAAIIDPPREGLDTWVRTWLKGTPIPKLVYVSCNPVTLARDLKDLLAGPYVLEDLRLFDFYPQTSHIEAVAKLGVKPLGEA